MEMFWMDVSILGTTFKKLIQEIIFAQLVAFTDLNWLSSIFI